ncbi:hypothetical protein I316_05468 [Kwoniella heveanensis BCC8398]|uniref:Alpha N-terminal protein methyltransferase 1 n=1 Tax=Kwoniella heveanensis BCC8398 TaxID=1296120 RepID=A0A1B9GP53_9TREE|nr:hypothetical protein I316_05468 [Kwoniella heveanensis BCC8398]
MFRPVPSRPVSIQLRESKRQKTNNTKPAAAAPAPAAVGSALKKKEAPGPVYEKGIEYWDGIEASVDGVLGGFGNGPVPHIEQLASRLLLLSLIPTLSPFPNPLTPAASLSPTPAPHRRVVLDVGAGIGRVTRHVLLPLFDDVVLLEPVDKFVKEAYRAASSGEWRDVPVLSSSDSSAGSNNVNGASEELQKENKRRVDEYNKGRGKRVRIIKRGLQELDPRFPGQEGEELGIVGEPRGGVTSGGCGNVGDEVVYDTIWAQWCLGHMSHVDLINFLKLSKKALREADDAYIFVKENCCDDGPDGVGQEFLDEEDSSLTR